jgi:hypothetical protein
MGERDLVLQCLGRCVAIYTGCGMCGGYGFICRVFCRFIDTWAGVFFEVALESVGRSVLGWAGFIGG